jgi:Haem-NO-binding
MKGVVFNLLESFVCENWGPEAYDTVLSRCQLSTQEPFVGPGTYPDSDLYAVAGAVAQLAGLSLPDALRAFGRYCFPHLAAVVPKLATGHADAASFLKSVDKVIHMEVRKLYPRARTPSFTCVDERPDRFIVRYRSERKLCAFMEGLLEGTGVYFQTRIQVEHVRCMHQGHEYCELDLRFEPEQQRQT